MMPIANMGMTIASVRYSNQKNSLSWETETSPSWRHRGSPTNEAIAYSHSTPFAWLKQAVDLSLKNVTLCGDTRLHFTSPTVACKDICMRALTHSHAFTNSHSSQ